MWPLCPPGIYALSPGYYFNIDEDIIYNEYNKITIYQCNFTFYLVLNLFATLETKQLTDNIDKHFRIDPVAHKNMQQW